MNKLFSREDIAQMEAHGLDVESVKGQIETFKKGLPPARLVRPCTVGDGIFRLGHDHLTSLAAEYPARVSRKKAVKFVPASGAATRMFQSLIRSLERGILPGPSEAEDSNDPDLRATGEVLRKIEHLAFFNDLEQALWKQGLELKEEIASGRIRPVLTALLSESGMNYSALPKGMIKFHYYPGGARTAFEEHIVEALDYTKGRGGMARLHLTVSGPQADLIRSHIQERRSFYESNGRICEISYSLQSPATDTIAVDPGNRPFRNEKGRLVFRPGGHGALLENLERLDADLVFIKNVDNVVPDHIKPETYFYRTAMAALLLDLQDRVFGFLKRLRENPEDRGLLSRISVFAEEDLGFPSPSDLAGLAVSEQSRAWFDRLNRPMRVCAMVRTQGDPGGAPFWVEGGLGRPSPQIVETAQVDFESSDQKRIFTSSTHFNPTDMVAALRDYRDRPFDLKKFVDPDAAFITRKSSRGRDLKALEKPGLWNGSMAGWISIFVEVPLVIFNPVKTVNALLRPAHQPPDGTPGSPD